MRYSIWCLLFGHTFTTPFDIGTGWKAAYMKAADTCYNCGLTKEEAGITKLTEK